jgi:hypothetical protein
MNYCESSHLLHSLNLGMFLPNWTVNSSVLYMLRGTAAVLLH